MKRRAKDASGSMYVGVDVGGTSIVAALVHAAGLVESRAKNRTPRDDDPEPAIAAIEQTIAEVLDKARRAGRKVAAVGLAIPGVVDPKRGLIVVTPNMPLSGVAICKRLKKRFKLPVALGNDCNLGAVGEKWLGSARAARSVMAILVGTGIGGGFVQKSRLWRGAREAASEIGHMVVQIGGPECGCGNRGCLEALASRSAMERDLREAVAAGRQSVLSELCQGDLSVIRSRYLRQALEAGDELTQEVVHRAAEVLGYACLTVRHLLDPELIVLGGGVLEACSEFIMPVVEGIVASDRLPGAREGGQVVLSALGDDAVVLGAVALASKAAGHSPLRKRFAVEPEYPRIGQVEFGQITVEDTTYPKDLFITVHGRVKKRDKDLARQSTGSSHLIGPQELEKVCQGGPAVLIIGAGMEGQVQLGDDARRFLERRRIECRLLPTPEAAAAYNEGKGRRALLVHITC